jgi:hypothetical protein
MDHSRREDWLKPTLWVIGKEPLFFPNAKPERS